MHAPGCTPGPHGGARPALELTQVVRDHGDDLRRRRVLSAEQRAALRAIECCRTAALGGHLEACLDCGFTRPAYHSCRNRHCPKCQGLAQRRWIDERKRRILPTRYYHVVFTLPAELRPLARRNRARVYDQLFRAAAETLHTLAGDPRWLGAQLGFTAVLHTWTRELTYHPHLHCIVTAGGLSDDASSWIPSRGKILFPVHVLAKLFRGKMLGALRRQHRREPFALATDDPRAFEHLVDQLFRKRWVVYAKRPFDGAEHVYEYLGRYTHRVALTNQRLVAVEPDRVTFSTKQGRTITLPPVELLGRFVQHVLPHGFTKIRHYGLMAGAHVRGRLEVARRLLEPDPPAAESAVEEAHELDWQSELRTLTGRDVRRCPRCAHAPLRRSVLLPRTQRARAPPREGST